MDSNRFDAFARKVSAIDSRRNALKGLAAAGLGLGLARIGLGESDAKNKKRKKGKKKVTQTCKKGSQCQGSLVCQNANSQNSCFPSTVKRCCKQLGERCDSGCECCGVDVICNGHICQSA